MLPDSNNPTTPPVPGGTQTPPPANSGTGDPVDYRAQYELIKRERDEYYGRWTGLQGKYNQEQQKWQADAQKLQSLESQVQEILGQKTSLDTQFKTLQESSNSTVGELTSLKAQHDRLNTVVTEFPSLIPFLAVQQGDQKVDLLPQGSGEELRTKLSAFSSSLQAQIGMMQKPPVQPPAGSTPPAPPAATAPGIDELRKQMARAVSEGKTEEYDRLYSELLKLRQSQTSN